MSETKSTLSSADGKSVQNTIIILGEDSNFDFKCLRNKCFKARAKQLNGKMIDLSPTRQYSNGPNCWLSEQAERISVNEYNQSHYMKMVRENNEPARQVWMEQSDLQNSILYWEQIVKVLHAIPTFEAKDYANVDPCAQFRMYDIGTLVFGKDSREYRPYLPYVPKTIFKVGDVMLYDIQNIPHHMPWQTVEGRGYYLPMTGYGYAAESIDKILSDHLDYDLYDPNLAIMVYWIKDLIGAKMYLTGLKYDQKTSTTKYPRHEYWSGSRDPLQRLCQAEFDETIMWITKQVPQFKFSWNRAREIN